MIVLNPFSAMRAGKEIINADTWKKRQALTATIYTLLVSGVGAASLLGYSIPIFIDTQSLQTIASLLGMVGFGVFQLWATFATSKRIGLPSSDSDVLPGTIDGIRDGATEGRPHEWIRELDDRDPFQVSDMRDRG